MAVHSKQLVVASSGVPNAEHIVYTAPPGETVIIKDLHLSWKSGSVTRAVCWVDSGPLRVSLIDRPLASTDQVDRALWVVLRPGDQIGMYSQAGEWVLWVSGTELDGLAD